MAYFRFDPIKVKSGNQGGRMFSAQLKTDAAIHNGYIGYLGGYKTGETEIRDLEIPTAALIKGAMPVIVSMPEINYKQNSLADNALGEFVNKAGHPVRVYTLEQYDEISLSADWLDASTKVDESSNKIAIAVGDIFTIAASGTEGSQLVYTKTAPANTVAKCYFKVTGINNSWTPIYVHSDGARFPQAYKMIDLEVVMA